MATSTTTSTAMCSIPTEFSDSPYTISSGSDVSYGVHLDGDVYDLSSYIVGFSYGNIHSPYTDYTGYACFVNSYGSGDYDAWEDSYGQPDYWWLRSPDSHYSGWECYINTYGYVDQSWSVDIVANSYSNSLRIPVMMALRGVCARVVTSAAATSAAM